MKRTALLLLTAMAGTAALTVSAQQTTDRVRALPGDRPAPNTARDALGGDGRATA